VGSGAVRDSGANGEGVFYYFISKTTIKKNKRGENEKRVCCRGIQKRWCG